MPYSLFYNKEGSGSTDAHVFGQRGSIAAALSLAILLVAVSYKVALLFPAPQAARVQAVQETAPTATADITEVDSDGDGVPDWQEQLLGTDPKVADKDKASAALSAQNTSKTSESSQSATPITDQALGTLITTYAQAVQSGTSDTRSPDQMASTIMQSISAPNTYSEHTLSEIKTSPDTSSTRISKYQTDMQKALEPLLGFQGSEITLIGQYVQTQDPAALDKLSAMANTYDAVTKATLAVTVPANASATHLEIVNSLGFFGATLHTIVLYARDPIASLTLLRTFNDGEKRLNNAFATLGNYFQANQKPPTP